VLGKNNEIIPGLFASGNCAGGLYGDSYELETSGGALGFAVNSGRIAGENALKLIRK
jgi:fumarate reductase flavoprotein subunit